MVNLLLSDYDERLHEKKSHNFIFLLPEVFNNSGQSIRSALKEKISPNNFLSKILTTSPKVFDFLWILPMILQNISFNFITTQFLE